MTLRPRHGASNPGLNQPNSSHRLLADLSQITYHKNETNYRRVQTMIYDFLERPKTWPSITYNLVIFFLVLLCLVFSILSTIKEFEQSFSLKSMYLEFFMLILFFAEYCIRTWSAGCRSRYQSWRGRLRFARKPFCVVDILIILTSIVILSAGNNNNGFAASIFRGLRFFQILRMIRIDRRGGSFKLLASVVWAHRQELFTTIYIGFLVLISSSFLIYLVEKEKGGFIESYADALWWGVITLCTVGYGDTVPKTWPGKIIASFCALAGISFFALPAGILGSGFALKVQQHQRQKHLTRRRVPAAQLIQCVWRCCAIAKDYDRKSATWKVFMKKKKKSPTNLRPSSSMMENYRVNQTNKAQSFYKTRNFSVRLNRKKNHVDNTNELTEEEDIPRQIKEEDDGDERSRYLSIENSGYYFRTASRESIIDSFQMQSNTVPNTPPIINDSEDGHRAMYNELINQNEIFTLKELTRPEEIAIKYILKTKFFLTRKKFKEALKPYDVKDVIEQYSAGNLDMLARIKSLQSRLDCIVSEHDMTAPDVKDSMNTRISKIDTRLRLLDKKLEEVLILFRRDGQQKRDPSHYLDIPIIRKDRYCSDFSQDQSSGDDSLHSVNNRYRENYM